MTYKKKMMDGKRTMYKAGKKVKKKKPAKPRMMYSTGGPNVMPVAKPN